MQQSSIAIIGAGNMGAALVASLIAQNFQPQKIWLSDPTAEKLEVLQHKYGVKITTDNLKAVLAAEVLILAVKPQQIAALAKEIKTTIQKRSPLIISIVTGIHLATFQKWFGADSRLIRCMPNTPMMIGYGAIALFSGPNISENERTFTEMLFAKTGLVLWLEKEETLNAVTALSGSGPAYFFYIIDALEKAAVSLGLTPQSAHRLATQTALGAAQMVAKSSLSIKELERQVTSPGGTTEAAIRIFDQHQLDSVLAKGLNAAHTRAIELSESFDA